MATAVKENSRFFPVSKVTWESCTDYTSRKLNRLDTSFIYQQRMLKSINWQGKEFIDVQKLIYIFHRDLLWLSQNIYKVWTICV
jgi:hypothetical protein